MRTSLPLLRTLLIAAAFPLVALSALAQAPANAPQDLVERGRYLATAGDCVACHTAPQGTAMAGGLAIATPLGPIYSTNITPSKTTGIGNYTLAQFTAALRQGRRADGAYLYPAMPYTAYAKATDDDMAAMYAYFMHGVAPVDSTPPATRLPFPFSIRASMAAWNALFLDTTPYQANTRQAPEWNRGAYLVQGLAHCGACHTPRNALMAEDPRRSLGGGEAGPWHAPNISSDLRAGIGGWSEDELVHYMHEGHVAGKGSSGGPMAEAVDHSLGHLTEADLHAMAVYLKSTPAIADPAATQPAYSWGQATDQLASIRGVALPQNLGNMTGPQLYDAFCASCHQAQAQGSADGKLPALFHHSTVGRSNTNNLVLSILQGVPRHGRDSIMPAFAHELTDAQVTTLSNYLLKEYGNPKARVTDSQVARLRSNAPDNTLVNLVRAGMVIGALVVLLVLAWVVHRLLGRRHHRAR